MHEGSALLKKETEQVNERMRQVLMPHEMQQWESNAVLLEVPYADYTDDREVSHHKWS